MITAITAFTVPAAVVNSEPFTDAAAEVRSTRSISNISIIIIFFAVRVAFSNEPLFLFILFLAQIIR